MKAASSLPEIIIVRHKLTTTTLNFTHHRSVNIIVYKFLKYKNVYFCVMLYVGFC